MKRKERRIRDKKIVNYQARFPDKTLEELGERFELSVGRISQILTEQKEAVK